MTINQKPYMPACFAPEITNEVLAKYKELVQQARNEPGGVGRELDKSRSAAVYDEMDRLINMVEVFQKTPTSKAEPVVFRIRPGVIGGRHLKSVKQIPLEAQEITRIDDVVPYDHELRAMGKLFQQIDEHTHKELRNAAFHLQWYGKELCLDREPMTLEFI